MKKITLFTILLFTIFSCSSISPSNLNIFLKRLVAMSKIQESRWMVLLLGMVPIFTIKKPQTEKSQSKRLVAHRILPSVVSLK